MLSDYHCDILLYFRLLNGIMTESKPAAEVMAGNFCPQSAQSNVESFQQKGQTQRDRQTIYF